MLSRDSKLVKIIFQIIAILLAFAFTSVILKISKGQPLLAYQSIIRGSLGSVNSFANVLVAWVPLLLAVCGVLITFSAGLWNIGIEGQITIGAIFSTGLLRIMLESTLPSGIIIILCFLAGMAGGALWAAFAGALKVFGGINEIFGGLGLNFVATALTIWLIFGPWKRPGIASMSGTEQFPAHFRLPLIEGLRLSWWSIAIGVICFIIVYFLLSNTYFGLRLKAIGKNAKAASLFGIKPQKYFMISFIICGMFAGIAGTLQVVAVYYRLIPSISSGYGFLGLLVAMLVNYQAIFVVPVSLLFASLNIGSIQLPIVLKLDSTLSGILQGSLVLFVMLLEGVRSYFAQKAKGKRP